MKVTVYVILLLTLMLMNKSMKSRWLDDLVDFYKQKLEDGFQRIWWGLYDSHKALTRRLTVKLGKKMGTSIRFKNMGGYSSSHFVTRVARISVHPHGVIPCNPTSHFWKVFSNLAR